MANINKEGGNQGGDKENRWQIELGTSPMIKYMTTEEAKVFWERYAESRKKIDEDFAKLPDKERLEIMEKMRACHEAIRNAKSVKKDKRR